MACVDREEAGVDDAVERHAAVGNRRVRSLVEPACEHVRERLQTDCEPIQDMSPLDPRLLVVQAVACEPVYSVLLPVRWEDTGNFTRKGLHKIL